jgi:DNA-binding transcriptional regulator YdaS (Cro superfamily)
LLTICPVNAATITPIQRAAKIAGGAAELARIADVSVQAAYQWINGNRPVPAERAPLIERSTGVRCEELCPGVPWDIIRAEAPASDAAA